MQQLPNYNTNILELSLMQSKWASIINPLLASPFLNGQVLTDVALKSGANTINHLLSRKQQGWVITDQSAAASLYRSQPLNDKTLTLTASAPCTVSIWVF